MGLQSGIEGYDVFLQSVAFRLAYHSPFIRSLTHSFIQTKQILFTISIYKTLRIDM